MIERPLRESVVAMSETPAIIIVDVAYVHCARRAVFEAFLIICYLPGQMYPRKKREFCHV